MSEEENDLEARIQKAIVDRDKLKRLEEQNARLAYRVERYRKAFEDIREQLGSIYNTLHEVIVLVEDMMEIE